jgi:hypothetical protein
VSRDVGMLPPYGQWLVNHMTGVNTFKGRPLQFGGETDPFWDKPTDIALDEHGKLLVAELASLFYPYRELEQRLHPGAMSDESSLVFPVPMKYKKSYDIKGGGLANDIRRASARAAERSQAFREANEAASWTCWRVHSSRSRHATPLRRRSALTSRS